MQKNRKIFNKVEKLAIRSAITTIAIIYIMLVIVIFMITAVEYSKLSNHSSSAFFNEYGKLILEFLIITLLVMIPIYFLLKRTNMYLAYNEVEKDYNKYLLRQKFIRGIPVQVRVLKTRNGNYQEYIMGLSYIAEFYATLDKKGNLIEISCKFFSDGIDRHFDVVTMEEFTSYYEIVEN